MKFSLLDIQTKNIERIQLFVIHVDSIEKAMLFLSLFLDYFPLLSNLRTKTI
jgi:hypothetical protein